MITVDLIRAVMESGQYEKEDCPRSLPFDCPLCGKEKPDPIPGGSTAILFSRDGMSYAVQICQQCAGSQP